MAKMVEENNKLNHKRKMAMNERGVVIGSAIDMEGQIFHKGAFRQHCAILHSSGKIYLKPIEGVIYLYSISAEGVYERLEDIDGRKPRKYFY